MEIKVLYDNSKKKKTFNSIYTAPEIGIQA